MQVYMLEFSLLYCIQCSCLEIVCFLMGDSIVGQPFDVGLEKTLNVLLESGLVVAVS